MDQIANRLAAIKTHNIYLYPGSGSFHDQSGSHIMLMPQYTCTEADIREIARRTIGATKIFFEGQEGQV
jgi:hypothetical protein